MLKNKMNNNWEISMDQLRTLENEEDLRIFLVKIQTFQSGNFGFKMVSVLLILKLFTGTVVFILRF